MHMHVCVGFFSKKKGLLIIFVKRKEGLLLLFQKQMRPRICCEESQYIFLLFCLYTVWKNQKFTLTRKYFVKLSYTSKIMRENS